MLPGEPEHREAQWLNENMASSWGRHAVDEYVEGVQLRRTNERRAPSAKTSNYCGNVGMDFRVFGPDQPPRRRSLVVCPGHGLYVLDENQGVRVELVMGLQSGHDPVVH